MDNLVSSLNSRGYSADGLHGDLRQNQRDNVMSKFRDSKIDILVATDVAARGIDVGNVDLVVNYDLPQDEEYYVHRIGRTARAGRTGKAISFVTGKDLHKLRTIIKYTKAEMNYLEIPTISDIDSKNIDSFIEFLEKELDKKSDLSKYRKVIDQFLTKGYTPTQIAEVLIKLAIEGRNKKTHENLDQVDYNKKTIGKSRQTKENFGKRKNKGKFSKIFINKGLRDGINEKLLVTMLMDAKIPKNKIGGIILNKNFSFVQLPTEFITPAIVKLNGKKVKGKTISAEISNK